MAGSRNRRADDEDDDRPRRQRNDDDDSRPRSRRRWDDDDRPRRRRRSDDDDDDLPRRRPRRKSRGPGIGKVLAIVCAVVAVVAIIAVVILLAAGTFSSGRADISYEKCTGISQSDTVEGLTKKFGRPEKYDRSEWGRVTPGSQGRRRPAAEKSSSLAEYNNLAAEVTAWYGWRKGQEEVYVAEGTDFKGRKGLVIKIYCNPKIVEDAFLKPNAPKTGIPWFQVDQIGGDGMIRFGGG
ncbi:MAG: hypothetical protein JWO38_5191 [Gemmataceae bacterium]|nr:hypothetical protein [Gemmataceae bacterium]